MKPIDGGRAGTEIHGKGKTGPAEINPLINLPYCKDLKTGRGHIPTNAVLSYLGRRLGLWGTTETEVEECGKIFLKASKNFILFSRNVALGMDQGTQYLFFLEYFPT